MRGVRISPPPSRAAPEPPHPHFVRGEDRPSPTLRILSCPGEWTRNGRPGAISPTSWGGRWHAKPDGEGGTPYSRGRPHP